MEDHQSELSKVYKDLDEGEIGIEEAMKKSNTLTAELAAQKGAKEATERMGEIFQEREAKEIQDKFLKDHPDFTELRDSGKLEPIKEELGGMHDDFSAYFAYRAEHAGEENASVEGEQINEPQTPLTETEAQDSMLKAVGELGEG